MNASSTQSSGRRSRGGLALLRDERGASMVGVMLVLGLLAVFALLAASLAVNERRTTYNDFVHSSSFAAADAGGEAAIAWLIVQDRPPRITDMASGKVSATAPAAMQTHAGQHFDYDVNMRRDPVTGNFLMRPRPGYDPSLFMDFVYDVEATGTAGVEGRSDVSVIVTKLTTINYQ